jgi:hypothetical protein
VGKNGVKWEPHKHDGLLIAVELELNGDVHTLPCPLIRDESGTADYEAIRRYFEEQDFSVGQILSIHHGMLSFLEPNQVYPERSNLRQ